jgi:hypothetical protein
MVGGVLLVVNHSGMKRMGTQKHHEIMYWDILYGAVSYGDISYGDISYRDETYGAVTQPYTHSQEQFTAA